MYILTFLSEYGPRVCLKFNKSQSIHGYKDYANKRWLLLNVAKENKYIFKGLKFSSH